jgi:methylenetetrahydrofolate reductase (NADPH)
VAIPVAQKPAALKLWGEPKTFADVASLFSLFCSGRLSALPWSDEPVAPETSTIALQLAELNELGFLTINSQPAVNGAKSQDKMFGWGHPNGYVYQKVSECAFLNITLVLIGWFRKAYLEFFVKPELLNLLLVHIERDPNITYHVINKQGDLRTNTHSEGPNAVTWGVFPGKEIIQPTIVEAVSFMAWKVRTPDVCPASNSALTICIHQDEAYELGQQWSQVYEADSPSRALIAELMETCYLVNVVHNDFTEPRAIFEPFLKAGAESAAKPSTPYMNGSAH